MMYLGLFKPWMFQVPTINMQKGRFGHMPGFQSSSKFIWRVLTRVVQTGSWPVIASLAASDDASDGLDALAIVCFLCHRIIVASFLSYFTGGCHTTKEDLFWLTSKPSEGASFMKSYLRMAGVGYLGLVVSGYSASSVVCVTHERHAEAHC